ncbi:MAG: tRNA (adenosine(37)-N6)-threonylcarbamoyltransferase complex dimerization subunit type 1 TsaB [Firmicutes bacterium]|nr:tRNA (adenosine(37)-N6)-threonylcarbamoyltransferase complex dimerization subunit type 1 TsaB [Bacillota bacterium]
MISLVIDTCTNNVVIGLLNGLDVIDQKIEFNDKNISTNFVPLIDELLKKNNTKITDIKKIFVAIGPGSFTGIRVGVTFAKVMAWSLNIEVVPFSSLELMASTSSDHVIIPLIDARRGYVYGGIYDYNLNALLPDEYILIDDLLKYAQGYEKCTFVSFDSFDFATKLPDVDIRKIVFKHFNDNGVKPHSLNPNYLKKTEAEEKFSGE